DCDGDPEQALTRQQMLDNISVYWFTATAASSARLYWESFRNVSTGPVEVPTAIASYPKEIFRPSRRWAERRYRNIHHFTEHERGGHFAAWEQPESFVDDVRAAFRSLR